MSGGIVAGQGVLLSEASTGTRAGAIQLTVVVTTFISAFFVFMLLVGQGPALLTTT